MPDLLLSHKGLSLRLHFATNTYYLTAPLRGKKNIYQLLFEHLVDGKTVSYRGLARELKKASPLICGETVKYAAKKIEAALQASKDKRLKKMRFVTLPRGGASPVFARKSHRSRLSVQQRPVVEETIRAMHEGGKKPTVAQIRAACKKALKENNLPQNVSLASGTIRSFKEGLRLSVQQPKRFNKAQRQAIGQTLVAMHRAGNNPTLENMRSACLQNLGKKGLAGGVVLSQRILWRLRSRLDAGQPLWAAKKRRRL